MTDRSFCADWLRWLARFAWIWLAGRTGLALFTNQMPAPGRPDVNLPGTQTGKHGLQLL